MVWSRHSGVNTILLGLPVLAGWLQGPCSLASDMPIPTLKRFWVVWWRDHTISRNSVNVKQATQKKALHRKFSELEVWFVLLFIERHWMYYLSKNLAAHLTSPLCCTKWEKSIPLFILCSALLWVQESCSRTADVHQVLERCISDLKAEGRFVQCTV